MRVQSGASAGGDVLRQRGLLRRVAQLLALALAEQVDHPPVEDGDQPGLEVLHRLQPVTGLERALQRVLHHVGGVRLRRTHPPREDRAGRAGARRRPPAVWDPMSLDCETSTAPECRDACHRAGTTVKA